MQKYKQLTIEQRAIIAYLFKLKKSRGYIAKEIGKDKSSVSREIKRNSSDGNYGLYNTLPAQKRRDERRMNSNRKSILTEEMKQDIKEKLCGEQWSPEQISGRIKSEGKDMVSYETIYQYVYEDKRQGGELYTNLRQAHRKRHKRRKSYKTRGIIKDRVSIDKRPKIVNLQKRYGDWEGDTIIGKNHKGALITLNERKSLFVKISKIRKKEAKITASKTINMLTPLKSKCFSMTFDNGKEFAEHKKIASELKTKVFFAHPYSSFERGCNENINGLIRQYFPKGMSFDDITDKDVQFVEDKLNNRPRKKLGFKTPNEIFCNFVALQT
jgi:transposase, IS30 family